MQVIVVIHFHHDSSVSQRKSIPNGDCATILNIEAEKRAGNPLTATLICKFSSRCISQIGKADALSTRQLMVAREVNGVGSWDPPLPPIISIIPLKDVTLKVGKPAS